MRIPILAAIAALTALPSAASAHPGADLLITDSRTAARAMSGSISFEETNGVHLFKGSPLKQDVELLGGELVASGKGEVRIEIRERGWRRIRHLRSQGFYSGDPYPSRAYTQGFYSGRP